MAVGRTDGLAGVFDWTDGPVMDTLSMPMPESSATKIAEEIFQRLDEPHPMLTFDSVLKQAYVSPVSTIPFISVTTNPWLR